jgi:hypothetical protein
MSGYYRVHRKWMNNPVFKQEPFTECQAWIWLIEEVAFQPRRVRSGDTVIELERGQLSHSLRFMAEAWGWSKSRVGRFVDRLQSETMVGTDTGTGQLVITLCNYEKFQAVAKQVGQPPGQEAGHTWDSRGTNYNEGNKLEVVSPSENDSSEDSKSNSEQQKQLDQEFEIFWSAIPSGQKRDKGKARKPFVNARASSDLETLCGAIAAYHQFEDTKGTETKFRKLPATWLNAGSWENDDIQKLLTNPEKPKAETWNQVEWVSRLEVALETRLWPSDWGSKPGDAECLVPRHMITEELLSAVSGDVVEVSV